MTDPSSQPQQPSVQRDPIVGAFMALLGEKRFEDIGFAEIARRAGVSLSELRAKHTSKIEMLAAYMREVDRAVLDGIDPGMADEPPRERLFDVLMRRLDILAPDKAAVKSLWQFGAVQSRPHARGQRPATRSMQWMLDRRRHLGDRTQGHGARAGADACCLDRCCAPGPHDDDPGQAKTLAALDRAMSSGQRFAGLLDDLLRIPEAACNATRVFGGRRRGEDRSDESAAA